MTPAYDFRAIASQMKAAQDDSLQIEPFTSQLSGFDVSSAYAVANLIHSCLLYTSPSPRDS